MKSVRADRRFEDEHMTQQLHRSEIAVRAARGVSLGSRRRLALAGLIMAASLALQTVGDAYGEPVAKPQVEVKAAVKKAKRNAGFHPEGVMGPGDSDMRSNEEKARRICQEIGGTYYVFNGKPLCGKS
jgi:hypothetical protein